MRPTYGLLLAIFTALVFGVLPLILKVLVRTIDPYTLTWTRFFLAFLSLTILRTFRGSRQAGQFTRRTVGFAAVAGLGLTANYLMYQSGIRFITPDTAQIVIQFSPAFLLVGGIVIYHEAFGRLQQAGLFILVLGMAFFLKSTGHEIYTGTSDYAHGVWLVGGAALAWAIFALAQKAVVGSLGAINTMRVCYGVGVVLLLPTASFGILLNLDFLNAGLLALSVALTVASYVTFAESLRHLEASRVSLVLANVPLLTLAATRASDLVFPNIIPIDHLGLTGMVGAMLVVGGSMLGATGRRAYNKEPRQVPI